MSRQCVICLDEGEVDSELLRLPCLHHHICSAKNGDCLQSMYEQAIVQGRLASCCGIPLVFVDYQDNLPVELVWKYIHKESELAVDHKRRVYCASPSCGEFLHPDNHEENAGITFSKCPACPEFTCTGCKTLITTELAGNCKNWCPKDSNQCKNEKDKRCEWCDALVLEAVIMHPCEVPAEDMEFEIAARGLGYQKCPGCENTVELSAACNHVTCNCGAQFCHVCGNTWESVMGECVHGCPKNGKPEYDEDGYNEEGFHKIHGRNRQGRNRRDMAQGLDLEGVDLEGLVLEGIEEEDMDFFLWGLDPDLQQDILNLAPAERTAAMNDAHAEIAARAVEHGRIEDETGEWVDDSEFD